MLENSRTDGESVTAQNGTSQCDDTEINGKESNRVLPSDPNNKITLTWKDLNVFVKSDQSFMSYLKCKSDEDTQKQLLFEVSGQVKSGQLLAIMGPSGAGKTTLLNVLTSRNVRLLQVKGQVLTNGQNIGKAIRKIAAYVQQHDMFIGTLTVREHLIFQALLRMDEDKSYKEREFRVEEVIHELGLTKCKDTMIGIAGRIKGISGGEAKRLAFASEVLTNPSLMFCDEPTSGLDSYMSQNVVSVLKQLAASGRTIICTIHQPSSLVYALFDHLLLLAEGKVAFQGKTEDAIAFFERVGLRCPKNYNPADFFIQHLSIVPGNEVQCRDKISAICSLFEISQHDEENSMGENPTLSGSDLRKSKYKTTWCTQFRAVLWRSWINVLREPMLTKARIIQSILQAFLLSLVYFQQITDEKGVMNINGALFIMLLNTSFQTALGVVNTFFQEQEIFFQEHAIGMYRPGVYFLCKSLAEVPILSFVTLVYVTIMYWMVGFYENIINYLIALGTLILIAHTAASFGYMLSCLCTSLTVTMSIATPVIMPFVLFGGFYLNASSVPWYFLWLKYASWFYYGNEILAVNQWTGVKNITCGTSACPPDGDAVLKSLNFGKNHFSRDILAILALLVGFRLAALIGLIIKSHRRS